MKMSCQRKQPIILAAATAVSLFSLGVSAFAPQRHSFNVNIPSSTSSVSSNSKILRQTSRLYGMLPRDGSFGDGYSSGGGDNNNEEDEAITEAREKLEMLMTGSGGGSSSSSSTNSDSSKTSAEPYDLSLRPSFDSSVPSSSSSGSGGGPSPTSPLHPSNLFEELLLNPPPLTTIARTRQEAEISSLSTLIDSDDAVSDLWTLWFAERGPKASRELMAAEQLAMSGPKYWPKAEAMLRDLIDEHGVHWSEPVNRLATLLYQQGRLKESKELCEVVLSVKPWHFGALSGIVLVCAGLGDAGAARMWAARRLPPLRPDGDTTERRVEWVERAVREASRSLKRAEDRIQREFEHCDDEENQETIKDGNNDADATATSKPPRSVIVDDDFEDAWQ